MILISGCFDKNTNSADQSLEKDEKVVTNIETTDVKSGTALAVFKTTASIEADRQAVITSRTSGVILNLLVEEGDYVNKGDILIELESDIQQLDVETARANYEKNNNQLSRAESLLAKGITNKESVDNLRYENKALKSRLDQALMQLSFTKIRAPFSGVISKRLVKIGNLITSNAPVYELVDFSSLQAKMEIPEHHWRKMKEGLGVHFLFDALKGEVVKSQIERINPSVDPATGTFTITVLLRDSEQTLRPGLFAKAEIIYDEKNHVMLVDKNAVIIEDGRSFVYIISDGLKANKRFIELGYEMPETYEVVSGLKLGDIIATTGKNNLTDGTLVKVVQY